MSIFKQFGSFLKETKKEMRKVTWSTKKELFQNTVTVLLFVFLLMLFFMASDFVISFVVKHVFN